MNEGQIYSTVSASISRPGDFDSEAAAVVGNPIVVNTQKKRPCLFHLERYALANKKEFVGHYANPSRSLGAIDRGEACVIDSGCRNEGTDQGIEVVYPPASDPLGFLKG
jgi:hypothetical protein